MAERQFGPYRLVRQIAVGGMAEIHLAKTKGIAGFEKYCALKMIHPNFAEDEQFIQMLVDEAKIAVQLTHGNIAQTFDLGRVGETYYITMEYVDGADLYKILRRASEQDIEMPLDVCAFIAKEIASALDHAHRKRDNFGKSLGIVHRDVSPQNVLISYAGEVKLVDFGIAKATMKARQTAVGVIKGKYYYMSPEQAWGDPIDYRSDIFSAGIVLYEMMTGQMLYLEEDLHKLLDMARKAEIQPPSKLRRGVPPQLERIVMHALQKNAGERYQSAGDLAADLERFLHAYAPVFTASKISGLMRRVIGDPVEVPVAPEEALYPSVEIRAGVHATHTLDTADLVHERDEIRDENSVIFRVADLKAPAAAPAPARAPAAAPAPARAPAPAPAVRNPAPRTTRPADPLPSVRSRPPTAVPKIPSIAEPARVAAPPSRVAAPPSRVAPAPAPSPAAPVAAQPRPAPARPRQAHEETRQLGAAPGGPDDESGLLTIQGQKLSVWDQTRTHPGDDDLFDNIGERTVITSAPGGPRSAGGGGFMMDVGGEDGVEATLITQVPGGPDADSEPSTGEPSTDEIEELETSAEAPARDTGDEEGPTIARGFAPRKAKAPPPAALAAKIHAPAVSELRKPKPSRRTPPGGVPQANVLQQIVSAQSSEPMPVPRPIAAPVPPAPPPMVATQPPLPQHQPSPQFPAGTPGLHSPYAHDASGLPLGIPTPPSGVPVYATGQPQAPVPPPPHPMMPGQPQVPGVPAHLQPYLHVQGMPPGNLPGYPTPPGQVPYAVTPASLYPYSPYGQPPPQPMTLTGQMRLFEVDEIPSQYKLGAARRRWFAYIVAGLIAVSVAAATTFFIIRTTRDAPPTTGSIHIDSMPAGAEVTIDGTRMTDRTPLTIDGVPVGTRHEIRVELARHKPYTDTIDVPKSGGKVPVMAMLQTVTGKLVVNSQPGGAEIWIDEQLRGRTPTTLIDIDMGSAKKLELRLKDHQPYIQALSWPASGQISLDVKLQR